MLAAVTGSNGFIGQHLCARLRADGWTARAGVRRDLAAGAIDEFVAGADVVIHAAGATRAPSEDELRQSNVELTRRVASAAASAGVGRFVFISSQAAAGPAATLERAVTESDEPRPIEAYGRSKLAAERVVRDTKALASTIVRPAAVFGPADRDFLALFRLAKRGVALHPGNRAQWISLVHVDDVVDGVMLAATSAAAIGGTYFLANDAPVQWLELYRQVAMRGGGGAGGDGGRRIALDIEIPHFLVGIAASIGDVMAKVSGKAGLLTSGKAALTRPRFWVCSNARARHELGFTPRVSVGDGLAAVYDWYDSHGWL
jgi:nucleoside-diphosphate-sugar epimerase